jgi:hypothetical protein
LSFIELIHHYKNYGKKEGRFGSEKQIKDLLQKAQLLGVN